MKHTNKQIYEFSLFELASQVLCVLANETFSCYLVQSTTTEINLNKIQVLNFKDILISVSNFAIANL